MALDKDLLDPSVDLKPHLQGAFEKMAQQDGGRNNRVQQYRVLASQGKGPSEVMALSYDEQMKRDQEKITPQPETDIRNDPRFFSDAHLVGMEGINPVGYPFGQQPTGGNLGTGDSSPMASPLGGANPDSQSEWMPNTGNPNQLGTTGGGTAPVIDPSQIDVSKVEAIQKQINDLLSKPHPVYEGAKMPDPTGPQAALTALALLFAPNDQAGNILEALHGNLDAVRKRNDIIHQVYQQTQDANDKAQLEALMQAARVEESRAFHQAQLTQQANITNAGNQVKTEAQNRMDRRLEVRNSAAMQKLEATIKAAPMKKAQELQALLDQKKAIYKSLGYDDEEALSKAAEEVNSADTLRLAQQGLTESRKLTEDTLRPLRESGMKTEQEYKQALTDYLPDRIAAQFAGILLADERLKMTFEMFRQGLDQKTYESSVKDAEGQVSDMQTKFDKLREEASKAGVKHGSDLANAKETVAALKPLVIDPKTGTYFDSQSGKQPSESTEIKYREAVEKLASLLSEDGSNVEEAMRQAETSLETAKERLKSVRAQKPAFTVGAPASGGNLLNRAKGMLKGKGRRPAPMPGNIPVDPTGPGYERVKGDTNYFLEGII